ncbi:prolyl oligopeptidase family serine peptidase [Mucilaginibacter litoreus]|uniref:Prolyl oligopeptidase family serine peptidase n=1 Tax=Mucilaginibacter litoreus TaxID=1048221 RepID=A0ABW3AM07_9SPHI
MKYLYLAIIGILSFIGNATAQKEKITNDTFKTWEKLEDYKISGDGKFVLYSVNRTKNLRQYLYDALGKKSYELNKGNESVFSANSKFLLYQTSDSLAIVTLPIRQVKWLTGVIKYQLIGTGNEQSLLLQKKNHLIMQSLSTASAQTLDGVSEFLVNKQGSKMLVKQGDELALVSLPQFRRKSLLKGNISSWTFDRSGENLAFILKTNNKTILYKYGPGLSAAQPVITDFDPTTSLTIADEAPTFSPNGRTIYFKVRKINHISTEAYRPTGKIARVWSYKDVFLNSNGLTYKAKETYWVSKLLSTNSRVIQMENDSTEIISEFGNNVILVRKIGNNNDAYFNPSIKSYCRLIDLRTGVILKDKITDYSTSLSPSEKYLTWYESNEKRSFCYSIVSRRLSITPGQPVQWGIADKWFLTADGGDYDILKVDPEMKVAPINITNSYGRNHNVNLSLIENDLNKVHVENETLILKANDPKNQQNGLFFKKVDVQGEPYKLLMEFKSITGLWGLPFKKAQDADAYLFCRQSVAESPNLFYTKDFKIIDTISHIYPERKYNWMNGELIHYPITGYKNGAAILYKPESFDPQKKYPVIFYYYQNLTETMNEFKTPDLSAGLLSIPWYVSNGYIVCTPDIINDDGAKIVEETVGSVEGAANYLKKFSWIDGSHMGIQGHSFGGYETAILITNSHLFAAAQASAGFYDIINARGGMYGEHTGMDCMLENGEFNIRRSIWEDQDAYFRSSAVLKANEVTTPILIEHGRGDSSVPFSQALEMFTALRRLKKPAWLLEYDCGHLIIDEVSQLDFTVKQQQFFGHYLKGEPMPDWMK